MSVDVAVGIVLGALSGLGIGGGSLMLLWLTLGAGFSPETARQINLLYYIPTALTATLLRRDRSLAPKAVLWTAALSGIAGTVLGGLLGSFADEALLRKAMGVLFLLTGLREILYRDRELR